MAILIKNTKSTITKLLAN